MIASVATRSDDRIPLRFGTAEDAGPGDALLLERGQPAPPAGTPAGTGVVAQFTSAVTHTPFCGCCAGRGPAAAALGGLFQDRAIGRVAWFTRVLAIVADPAALADAVRSDRLVAARFRLER
jgi:hypothetical protein